LRRVAAVRVTTTELPGSTYTEYFVTTSAHH
jgi:hypothetical protein